MEFLSADGVGLLLAVLVAGAFAGFLAGLFGIGGGIVIVPALYFVFTILEVPEAVRFKVAVGTSLATILITSARSVQAHAKKGAVDFEFLRRFVPFVAVGAFIGAMSARYIDAALITIIFIIGLLLFAGQKLLVGEKRPAVDLGATQSAPVPTRPIGVIMALLTGIASALMGIGGGVFGVLILTHYKRTIHKAVATASGFGIANAIPGTIGMGIAGWGEAGLPLGSVGYVNIPAFMIIAAMTFLTVPFGARTAHALSQTILNRFYAAYLLLTAALLIRDIVV